MPRPTKNPARASDSLLENLVAQIDARSGDAPAPDTVPTGFASLDRMLAGGLRRKDLVVLAGDVGSGKSALGLGVAIRAAGAGVPTLYFSGEMSPERVLERALAVEGRAAIDIVPRRQLLVVDSLQLTGPPGPRRGSRSVSPCRSARSRRSRSNATWSCSSWLSCRVTMPIDRTPGRR